ncbi:MAG TPA: DUF4279 domain-containing protein [Thermoanaerobaculia bacterium]|nr:DUF4279 domain-containing protein [Thermoanaerobaculia bacterium]
MDAEESTEDYEYYFAFSASLRVLDAPERHEEIERMTGLRPSHVHLRGDLANEKSGRRWTRDVWGLKSPLSKETSMTEHLFWLWEQVKPHQAYFESLIAAGVRVDVFCGYRSNCGYAGFDLNPEAFEIVRALRLPFEISVIVT